ncbi:MAG: NADH-quinone reductase, partial [Nitrospirae bacterium]|nr:NADH-quinone reductase [Nitrospirota bacterium]
MDREFAKLFEIFVASAIINNFVFTRFLGLCIFFGVTKKVETAVGMSITFTAVMMISAAMSWVIFTGIMVPLDITFLKIVI